MTVIRPSSISGINSITANGGDINVFRADGLKGDVFINNITGVAATFTNISVGSAVTTNSQGIDVTGIVTATTFKGDGSQLSNVTSTTINSNADNRVITGSNTANTLNGETNVVIDSTGRLLVGTGHGTSRNVGDLTAKIQLEGSGFNQSSLSLMSNAGASAGNTPHLTLGKSRGSSNGDNTIVANDDALGQIQFAGADGTDCNTVAASIIGRVDGTPGSNDMPGRLVFSTTADGSASPTERFRIGSAGQFGIGGATYGTAGQVLTSGGASAAPTWGGAGKILQVKYKRGGVTTSSNSGGWTDSVESGLNVDITPIASSSFIIVQMHSVGGNTSSGRSFFLRLRRKINNTGDTGVASFQIGDGNNGGIQSLALTHVDNDPGNWNTSHVINYRIRFGQDGSGTARFDYATTSVLYAMEIQP